MDKENMGGEHRSPSSKNIFKTPEKKPRLTPGETAESLVRHVLSDATNNGNYDTTSSSSDDDAEKRLTPLRDIFTRNYPSLRAQVVAATPHRRTAIIQEAQLMSPFLSGAYRQSHTPEDPNDLTPERTTRQHTRKRERVLSREQVRTLADEHLDGSRWSPINIDGYGPIYQNDALIDPWREVDGLTNLERMIGGQAPIGPDNEPVNIHHVVQGEDGGYLAEISGQMHRRESGVLHRGAPGIVNRFNFNLFKMAYWAVRAFCIMASMGIDPTNALNAHMR